jgi:hypothetical protein
MRYRYEKVERALCFEEGTDWGVYKASVFFAPHTTSHFRIDLFLLIQSKDELAIQTFGKMIHSWYLT